jgi:hypothetical protein
MYANFKNREPRQDAPFERHSPPVTQAAPQVDSRGGKKNKKKPKWRNSKARAMLVRMLMDKESSVHKLTWREIRASHKWFQEYDPKSFQRHVMDLRKANPQKVAVITEDNNIIKGELERFARPIKTNRGEPFWDNHPAKLLCEKMSKQVNTSK